MVAQKYRLHRLQLPGNSNKRKFATAQLSSVIHQRFNDEIWHCDLINRKSQIRGKQAAVMKRILTETLALPTSAAAGRPRPKVAGNLPLSLRKTHNISLLKTIRVCVI